MRRLRWLMVLVPPLAALAVFAPQGTKHPAVEAAPAPLPRRADARGPDLSRAWPTFGGTPARNMANPFARGIVDYFSVKRGAETNVRWSVPLGGSPAVSVPAVAGSRVFVGANNEWERDAKVQGDKGVMLCLCATSGELLWQITHDRVDESKDLYLLPIESSPCVDGERVYYVSNRAEVVCADVHGDGNGGGKILWSFDMIKHLGVFPSEASVCSPVVFGDGVFMVTGNGVYHITGKLPAPNAPAFLALNKRTGKVLWHSNLPGKGVMRGQWGNPSAAVVNGRAQVLFPGGDGWLYSFDPKTGELLWKFDCNPKKATPYKVGGHGEKSFSVLTAPVIHEGKVYVAVGQDPESDGHGVGHLWCIDVTKKPANKDKDLSPLSTTLKVGKDTDERFDPKDKKNKESGLVWHYGGRVVPAPKNDEDSEYVFGRSLATVAIHEGLLYVTEVAGYLHCLDAKTGKRHWVYDFEESTWNSPFYADGKVFVGTDSGTLYVFRHGKTLTPPRKIKVPRSLKTPPVAANGVLYLSSGDKLYALARP